VERQGGNKQSTGSPGNFMASEFLKTSSVLFLCAALASQPAAAEGLPDLGDSSESAFSLAQEREIGEEIIRQIRTDPAFLDDAEVSQYLNDLGYKLAGDTRVPLTFFGIRDPTINAFALPGGFIGVHTGLFTSAQSESELASVLSHEIAHVTQRHIARLISSQKKSTITSLAALAVALLASRSNAQISQAAVATAQATAIQSQLNFTREHEREADRVGLQILMEAGFDPNAMPAFFDRLQRGTRAVETSAPSYLRTHPLTFERIADIENRIQGRSNKQPADSLDFHLLRAKLKANQETPKDAIAYFEENLNPRKLAAEAGNLYGLVAALLRQKNFVRAEKEMATLRQLAPMNPIIENLAAQAKTASGKPDDAVAILRVATQKFPEHKALTYNYAEALLQARSAETALKIVDDQLQLYPNDARLYLLQAQSYAAMNKRLMQHQSQAEAYLRLGSLPQAIEQLQIALRAGDGDFYELSQVEARLKQLRALEMENKNK
jgi:beta-barrel assembly-enhancing protease